MAEYASAVVTATPTGMCRTRMRSGAVMTPAPTPVRAMTTAITKPMMKSMLNAFCDEGLAQTYSLQFPTISPAYPMRLHFPDDRKAQVVYRGFEGRDYFLKYPCQKYLTWI